MSDNEKRISFGGDVVESSLYSAGFNVVSPEISLVETADPRRRYKAILLQNAWNVIPRADFLRELKPYPRKMKLRAHLRRAVARWNLYRARRVVCLSQSVAEQLFKTTGISAVVAPATLPIHDWPLRTKPTPQRSEPFALVSGTITWYKRPQTALAWLEANAADIRCVRFMGKDDGSGCWQTVVASAHKRGLEVQQSVVEHSQTYALYAGASVTIMPSQLESLGFGMAEALLHSKRVVASEIPSHVEVASRAGGSVEWLNDENVGNQRAVSINSVLMGKAEATREWLQVGSALGLNV